MDNATMRKIYTLKPRKIAPESVRVFDTQRRQKVEKILNKKLTDREWFDYKIMLQGIKR
jgi:hypothetical protein